MSENIMRLSPASLFGNVSGVQMSTIRVEAAKIGLMQVWVDASLPPGTIVMEQDGKPVVRMENIGASVARS